MYKLLRNYPSLKFRILVAMGSILHRNAFGNIETLFVQITELITLRSLSPVLNFINFILCPGE